MKNLTIAAMLIASLSVVAAPAAADAERAAPRHAVAGEKLDSGLGEMAAYRASAVLGEKLDSGLGDIAAYRATVTGQKLDSGLGDLPHYRHWTDKTGKAPAHGELVAKAAAGERR